jgi:hypothetical protein
MVGDGVHSSSLGGQSAQKLGPEALQQPRGNALHRKDTLHALVEDLPIRKLQQVMQMVQNFSHLG